MGKSIISHPNEKPKLKATWWALILGICSGLILTILPFFASVIRPALEKTRYNSAPLGLNFGLFSPILAIASLIISIFVLAKGERSWAIWVGFIFSILVIIFWIFFILVSILAGT